MGVGCYFSKLIPNFCSHYNSGPNDKTMKIELSNFPPCLNVATAHNIYNGFATLQLQYD